MLTLDEYKKTRAGLDQANGHDSGLRHLEMIRQAGVKAGLLTGHPHWDTFLSYIQAAVESLEAVAQGFEDVLCDPTVVENSELLKAKIGLAECRAQIRTLNSVISLPKDLMAQGDQAKDILERMDAGNEGE